VRPGAVANALCWGMGGLEHGVDLSHARIGGRVRVQQALEGAVGGGEGDKALAALEEAVAAAVRQRSGAVAQARGGLPPALSAAAAVADHARDWLNGGRRGELVSMGVFSSAAGCPYGVPEGLYFSFPVTCTGGGRWSVPRLELSAAAAASIAAAREALSEERLEVEAALSAAALSAAAAGASGAASP